MATATLNLNITPKRMLTAPEAAYRCGLPLKLFTAVCPVKTVLLAKGAERYCVHDLDKWLDSLKAGMNDDVEAIIARLE